MNIGEQIKDRRTRAGLTQGQLAEAAGLANTEICRWECGVRLPSLVALTKLAAALDCCWVIGGHARTQEALLRLVPGGGFS